MNLMFDIQPADHVHAQIERFLRRGIQNGEIPAGAKLPPTSELARLWRVDNKTIQRAVAPLVAQGLVERCRKLGTFVRKAAQEATIAVLFGPSLSDESAHFYRALMQALREEARTHTWACRLYDGVIAATAPDEPRQYETIAQLEHDLQNYGFKGQIHICMRKEVSKRLEHNIPLPLVRQETEVLFDEYRFTLDSTAFLAQQGRRRLAYLSFRDRSEQELPQIEGLRDGARAQGLPNVEIVRIAPAGSIARKEAAVQREFARTIDKWRRRPAGMPDGLIVPDDIMMRAVASALLSSGVKVPEKIQVVTQAADRVQLHYGVPVARYEFPVDEKAKKIIELLWKKILREPVPDLPIMLPGAIITNAVDINAKTKGWIDENY